jgi:hypothetical protein
MLAREYRLGKKVPTRMVVLAIVLLAGVFSLAYGFYLNDQVMLYIGLVVVLLGSLNAIVFRSLYLKQ